MRYQMAQQEQLMSGQFDCPRCGFVCPAVVKAHSAAAALTAGAASAQAEAGLAKNMELLLSLQRCPKCGARSLARFAWSLVRSILVGVPIVAGTCAAFWVIMPSRDRDLLPIIGGGVYGLWVVAFVIGHLVELRRAKTCVQMQPEAGWSAEDRPLPRTEYGG